LLANACGARAQTRDRESIEGTIIDEPGLGLHIELPVLSITTVDRPRSQTRRLRSEWKA
jgi:hypothetical protein